jgi:hypothetical protein
MIRARKEGFVSTQIESFNPKSRAEAREATDALMVSVPAAVSAQTRMPDPGRDAWRCQR